MIAVTVLEMACSKNEGPPPQIPTPQVAYPAVGQMIEVWVYADAPSHADTCSDLLLDMIPYTAPGGVLGKTSTCLFGPYEAGRLSFTKTPDGVFHLTAAEVLLLHTKDLPSPYEYSPCARVAQYLLSTKSRPEEAGGRLVCSLTPPYRGEPNRRAMTAWGLRPTDTPEGLFSGDITCLELVRHLSRPPDIHTTPIPCVLSLPK
jgi:hypothetical protein